MRVALVATSLAAACSPRPTVLDITVPDGAAKLEILIATSCRDSEGFSCGPGVAWDDKALTRLPAGEVFELDRDARNLVDVPPSHHVREGLGIGNDSIDRLVLVAFDASDNPLQLVRIVDPPQTTDEQWNVDLTGAMYPDTVLNTFNKPGGSTPETYRAHVWRPPDAGEASCVETQTWDDNHNRWDREMYVPPSDHDCDGGNDCDEDWYQYPRQPTAAPVCTLPSPAIPDACVLGVETSCVDGSSPGHCGQATEVECIPDLMCAECPVLATGCGAAAIETQLAIDASRVPSAGCDFRFDAGGAPCASMGNDQLSLVFPFDCDNLALYGADWPSSNVVVVTGGQFQAGTTAMMEMHMQTQPCTLQLKFAGGPVTESRSSFVLGIQFASVTREILLPLSIRFSSTCPDTAMQTCDANLRYEAGSSNNDGMWSCLP